MTVHLTDRERKALRGIRPGTTSNMPAPDERRIYENLVRKRVLCRAGAFYVCGPQWENTTAAPAAGE